MRSSDSRCWPASVALGTGFLVTAMLYCSVLYPLGHHGAWYGPVDAHMLTDAGGLIWKGRLQDVYAGVHGLYALPLSFFLVAPVAAVAGHLRPGGPGVDPWVIIGPFFLSFGILLLHSVRRLAWEMGIRSQLWALQLATIVLVLVPEVQWGHLEDVLALICVAHALRLAIRRAWVPAALALSTSIAFKQWSLLLIPLLVLAAPPAERLKVSVLCCALPAVLGGLFVVVDPGSSLGAYLSPANILGGPGHPWLAPSWLGRHSSQVNRMLAVVAALVCTWIERHKFSDDRLLVQTAAVVLLIRPLTETINYSYYWSPGLLFLVVAGAARQSRATAPVLAWPVLALIWALPRTDGNPDIRWWFGELLALGAAYAVCAGRASRALPETSSYRRRVATASIARR